MDGVFSFKIGFGYGPVVMISVEIPMDLHDRISQSVGEGQIARYEFGFHFQEFIQRLFPKLDKMIHDKIDEWISEHYLNGYPEKAMHKYSLQSSWFED